MTDTLQLRLWAGNEYIDNQFEQAIIVVAKSAEEAKQHFQDRADHLRNECKLTDWVHWLVGDIRLLAEDQPVIDVWPGDIAELGYTDREEDWKWEWWSSDDQKE